MQVATHQETQNKVLENNNNTVACHNGDHNESCLKIDEQSNEQTKQTNNESELILVQDNAFSIKIAVPGLEPFPLQVTSSELVQELHQMLMDKEETCHRTCFSLQLDGQVLDNFSELKAIEGLKDGVTIRLVDEPYTVRDVRLHVRHINDLIHSIEPYDAYNGVNCNSLTFVNDITNGDICDQKNIQFVQSECQIPEYLIGNQKDVPLTQLHLNGIKTRLPTCIKQLAFSGWNPPPGKRKMKGDLLYLQIITCEDKRYHLTASTKGFYVNLSTDDVFNPKADTSKQTFHSLVDLLNYLSPTFKKNFAAIQKKRTQKHPFERIGTPVQVHSWLSPDYDHGCDWFRADDSNASKLGHEDHIPGHSRDWNEELQGTKELPRKTLPERLIRERAMFKVHSDFVNAATRGAMAVIDGNIMAINPSESTKVQMFIWNNMFFSLGFDVKDHYKDFGGDFAAYMAPVYDLQGVKALNLLDLDGIHTLGTVVIDYKGYRVTAQSIIPGILEKDQEQSVVYGSTDFGKTCVTNEEYTKIMEKIASALKLRPHKIQTENGTEMTIYSSIEVKGIIGNEGRHYLLDLLRTFPPDLNYAKSSDEENTSGEFPRNFRHKLCSLRQELVESFIDTKFVQYIKTEALNYQKQKQENAEQKTEQQEQKTDKESESTPSLEHKIAEFEVAFNPNIYQPLVKLADSQELIEKDVNLLKEAASFITHVQIPLFIKDLIDLSLFVTDGQTLTETLHARGINIRYLGYLTEQIAKHDTLSYAYTIATNEIISRCVKRIFRTYLQNVNSAYVSSAIAHFLNCYLSSFTKSATPLTNGTQNGQIETKKKKKNQKGKSRTSGGENASNDWAQLTQKSLWNQINEEASLHYAFNLTYESIDDLFTKYKLRKLTLLKNICQKNGIQMLLREYNFDTKNKETFNEEDIINLYPIVKHVPPKATDAYNFFTNGQAKIQQGYLKEGFELISESYSLLTNVYGALHPEICMCLRLLARLNYILGDYHEAMSTQHKAVMMCERLYGVDHSQLITEYGHLALYAFANGQINNSIKLLYRARYILLLNYGENHPESSLIDSNLGLILQAAGEHESALKFLEIALETNKKYYGQKNMKTGLSYHLVARLQSCRGDFRTALMNERETYQIYKFLLGEEHERTRESSQVLKHLTEQAVMLQKRMNEISRGEKVQFPIHIQQPSVQTVLSMLNIINGIIFIPTNNAEIERIREEIKKTSGVEKQEDVQETSNEVPQVQSAKINSQDDDLQ